MKKAGYEVSFWPKGIRKWKMSNINIVKFSVSDIIAVLLAFFVFFAIPAHRGEIGAEEAVDSEELFVSDPMEEREILEQMERELGIRSLERDSGPRTRTDSQESSKDPVTLSLYRITFSLPGKELRGELVPPGEYLEFWSGSEGDAKEEFSRELIPFQSVLRVEFQESATQSDRHLVGCRVVTKNGPRDGLCSQNQWAAITMRTEDGRFLQYENSCVLTSCEKDSQSASVLQFEVQKQEALRPTAQ